MSSFSNGACHWANGIEPESHQTSITSGTRRIVAAAVRAGEHDLVDVGLVQVVRHGAPPSSRELVARANA